MRNQNFRRPSYDPKCFYFLDIVDVVCECTAAANINPQSTTSGVATVTGLGVVGIRTTYELLLTLGILFFGLSLAAVVLYMSSRAFRNVPETTSRLLTVVIMVTAALVLITAGYSNDQVAPVFGLFGTIVGYILGRRDNAMSARDDGDREDAGRSTPTKPMPGEQTQPKPEGGKSTGGPQ